MNIETMEPQTPTTPQIATAPKKSSAIKMPMLIGIIISVFVIGVIAAAIFFGLSKRNAPTFVTISGKVHFTALKPDTSDKGDVFIQYRPYKSNEPFKTGTVVNTLEQDAPWSWTYAENGKTYELQGVLNIDGKQVQISEVHVVSAPASNQELELSVTWEDLPSDVVASQRTVIGGLLNLNGLLPDNGNVSIYVRSATAQEYSLIDEFKASSGETKWTWPGATPLETYNVRAVLTSSDGASVGESDLIEAQAGEQELELNINSEVKPATPTPTSTPRAIPTLFSSTPTPSLSPAPTATPVPVAIKGTVIINGPKDRDTTVLIMARKPGEGSYKEVKRIPYAELEGADWEWTGATAGEAYELMAILQVKGARSATTRSQVITAPAIGVDFILNTGVTLGKPGDKPILESCNANGSRYNATIKFPRILTAGNYWFQIGDNPGTSSIFSDKIKADQNADFQRITVTIDASRNYYARYGYSVCINCSNDGNFSQFSDDATFYCGNAPGSGNGQYKGYRCNTDLGVCELTKDDNAPYGFNNNGLTSCQRVCRVMPR